MNCLSVRLSYVFHPGPHRKLWSGLMQDKRRYLSLPGLPSTQDPLVIKHNNSLNYPPSFLFCYLERLVRSLVNLPYLLGVQNHVPPQLSGKPLFFA